MEMDSSSLQESVCQLVRDVPSVEGKQSSGLTDAGKCWCLPVDFNCTLIRGNI